MDHWLPISAPRRRARGGLVLAWYALRSPVVSVGARGLVGGVGCRVIGWASGWEDRIQGLTGTFAIRFGGGR